MFLKLFSMIGANYFLKLLHVVNILKYNRLKLASATKMVFDWCERIIYAKL